MRCYNRKIRLIHAKESNREYRLRLEREAQAEQEYISTLTESERQAFYCKKRAERQHIIKLLATIGATNLINGGN